LHSPEGVYQKWHCASTNMNVNDDGYVHRSWMPFQKATVYLKVTLRKPVTILKTFWWELALMGKNRLSSFF